MTPREIAKLCKWQWDLTDPKQQERREMSAFIVDTECMDRVLAGLDYLKRDGFHRNFCGFDIATQAKEIGQLLFNLNAEAVNQRYNEADPAPVYKPNYAICHKAAAYKAMQCLHYQCSEGNVAERPEYKALEQAISSLADLIISRLPEYEKAPW
jgi:hypothetical protein